MTTVRRNTAPPIAPVTLIVLGVILLAAGLSLSPDIIETTVFQRESGSLQWGPALFRALLVFHGLILVGLSVLWILGLRRTVASTIPGTYATATSESRTPSAKLIWLILAAICTVALTLRLIDLGSGLWHDEIGTLLDYVRPPLRTILTSFANQNQHMLYSVLAKASIAWFGESAWSLRLPAALFGTASVWAVFMLGRHLANNREALVASALLAVSYHHIWFSQNARGYSALLFFTTVATWLWLEALPRKSRALWSGYIVCVSLGIWSHLTMAFVAAAQGLLTLLILGLHARAKHTGRKPGLTLGSYWEPLVALFLCVTVTLQLFALSLPEFLSSGLHETSLPSEWTNPLWLVAETVRGLLTGYSGFALTVGAIVLLAGAALVCAGWFSILLKNWPAALAMTLPGLMIVSLMIALGHNLWPRFVFFSAGFAIIILVRGAFAIPDWILSRAPGLGSKTAARVSLAICLAMIAVSSASLPRYYALPKQDYEGALEYVEQSRGTDEIVVIAGLATIAYGRYYAPHWVTVESEPDLAAVRASNPPIWFVYSLPVHFKEHHPDILAVIERDFDQVREFPGTLAGGEVYVFRERPVGEMGSTKTEIQSYSEEVIDMPASPGLSGLPNAADHALRTGEQS